MKKASGENDYEDFLYQNTNSSMYDKKHNIAIMIVIWVKKHKNYAKKHNGCMYANQMCNHQFYMYK